MLSAYAKVIKEELPDAIQIANGLYLHQNLLEIIKKCISSNQPQTLCVESCCDHKKATDLLKEGRKPSLGMGHCKKIPPNVDDLTKNEKK